MTGITCIKNFIENPTRLYRFLESNVKWDERMLARKTASFGVAYNYSQMSYPDQDFPQEIVSILDKIETEIGFRPNNCLINFYLDGKSKMGFHSDQTEILEPGTGVAILSLGETRTLRFRNILNQEVIRDYPLPEDSLIYMTQEVQDKWQHAIPKSKQTKAE